MSLNPNSCSETEAWPIELCGTFKSPVFWRTATEFEFYEVLSDCFNTGSGAHPASFTLVIGGSSGRAQWHSARLRAGWSGVRVPAGAGNFLFTTASRPTLGPTQSPIQWVPGDLSLGVKPSGREADHSPPSSAEVKNAWSYTSTP
jgi:hypothetical protein